MSIIFTTLNAKYIHTNLAIRYLKAYSQDEFNIDIVEYTIKDPILNIVSDLMTKKPKVIGFSCYIWNIEETLKVISTIKKINPSIIIFVGGPEVSYDVPQWMRSSHPFDFIVIGEGEATVKHLLQQCFTEQNFHSVEGIAFREGNSFVVTPPRSKLHLSEIPSPYRFKEDIPHLSKRITYIETSRGCPFNCQFCLSSIETGVRYFNREAIKDDLRYLMEHGAKVIKFVDRTFNISRSYAMDMFQFLIDERKPGTVFQFEITADIMKPEVIQFLNDHAPPGLFRFEIGVQSTNDLTNDLVKRRQDFEKLTRTVTMVKDGGKIAQHLDLIAGLPEETYDRFRQTFNDVFTLRPEELQLGFLKLLRGTGLRINAKQFGYIAMEDAPYEILGNNVLTFQEIISIKQVEDVLEKYWNDHRMDGTLEYIFTHIYDSPFDFFQDFGRYWEESGWNRIGHQIEDLFTHLFEFMTKAVPEKEDMLLGHMKLDYFRHFRYKPRKAWWGEPLTKEERQQFYTYILEQPSLLGESFASLKLTEKDLHKHTILETLPFSMHNHEEQAPYYLLVYYSPFHEGVQFFTIKK